MRDIISRFETYILICSSKYKEPQFLKNKLTVSNNNKDKTICIDIIMKTEDYLKIAEKIIRISKSTVGKTSSFNTINYLESACLD